MMVDFPCIKCGQCCRNIGNIPQLTMFNKGDGICCHLKNNLCDIYFDRPLVCNVQEMYKAYFNNNMDRPTFIRKNLLACFELARGKPDIQAKIKILLEE